MHPVNGSQRWGGGGNATVDWLIHCWRLSPAWLLKSLVRRRTKSLSTRMWMLQVRCSHWGQRSTQPADILRLYWKEPTGHIVATLRNTLWKNPQWVAQVHTGHIGDKIIKEISGSILNEWLRLHAGHIVSHIVKETPGFFHKVPAGHIEATLWKKSSGSFKKYPLVTLVDTFWM